MKTNWKHVLLLVSLLAGTLSSISVAHATSSCSLPAYLDGYEVDDEATLASLGASNCQGLTIYQTDDIELNGWNTPIVSWYGTFDGRGFQITDNNSSGPHSPLFWHPLEPIQITNVHRSGSVGSSAIGTGAFVGYSEVRVTISGSSMDGPVIGDGVGYVGGVRWNCT